MADGFDLNKLTLSEKIIGGATFVFLVATFLPWFSVDLGIIGSADGNGWDVGFFWAGFPLIFGLLMCAQIAAARFSPQTKLPELPWPQVHLGLGVAAFAIVVLKLLVGEDAGPFDADRDYGLFLAVIAAAGLAYGGWLKWQEGGRATTAGGLGGPDTTPPPAAP